MSETGDFAVGDAVRLRVDGSPAMVVEAVEADGCVRCAWKDGAGALQIYAFPARSLRAVDAAPAGRATDVT